MHYADHIGLIDGLLTKGKPTELNQSEAMLNYDKLSCQRMRRLEKTASSNDLLIK